MSSIDPVLSARGRLAYASRNGGDPDAVAYARQDFTYEKLRRDLTGPDAVTLRPGQAAHLVALLVGGSDPEAVERFARAVAEAVYSLPGLGADDRARVASLVLDGGAA